MRMKTLLLFASLFIVPIFTLKAQDVIQLKPEEVQSFIKQKTQKKAVLVNLWATWCGPCIEEFPDIVFLAKKYEKDLEVVFISGDFLDDMDRVKEFLTNQNVKFTTYIKTGSESEFIEAVHSEWSGALPFTFILKKGGEEVAYWENKAEMSKFERYIQQAIQPK
ncbi:TlpA family protein disulfide reductase [bacterium]|nr:MAG: TlpA family protein disulfide reductase [bacterium]